MDREFKVFGKLKNFERTQIKKTLNKPEVKTMIRFIDITQAYYAVHLDDPRLPNLSICIFINTTDSRCLTTDGNQHTFCCLADVETMPEKYRERCLRLVPEGFFK